MTARASTDMRSARATRSGRPRSIPAYLRVIGAVADGRRRFRGRGRPRVAVAIPTGGMLPTGADAVVMIEHTPGGEAGLGRGRRPVAPGENVVRFDEDAARALRSSRRDGRSARRTSRCWPRPASSRCRPRRAARDDPRHRRRDRAPGHDVAGAGARARCAERLGRRARPRGWRRAVPGAIVPDDDGALRERRPGGRRERRGRDLRRVVGGGRDQTAAPWPRCPTPRSGATGLRSSPGSRRCSHDSGGIPIIGLPGNPRSALVVFRLIGMPLRPPCGRLDRRAAAAADPRELSAATCRRPRGGWTSSRCGCATTVAEPIFGSSALLSVLPPPTAT